MKKRTKNVIKGILIPIAVILSLLIAVGVALDTVRQLENQMLMRNYQGFLK